MRSFLGVAVGAAAGAFLAVIAAFTLIQLNAPDKEAEQQIKTGNVQEEVVQYGQR